MNVATLQLNSVGLSPNRLDYYFQVCQEKDVKLLLMGEYVLNPFFHELTKIPLSMLSQQSNAQLDMLKDFGQRYDITVVAPIVRVIKGEAYKSIAVVRGARGNYYDQQILINYKHWNEERFFANPVAQLQPPFTFRIGDLRIGVLAGFEIHFDWFWESFLKRDIDLVLLPTVSTFGSQKRWRELIQMRAFTNNCFILRANRIGEYKDELGLVWKFYGESLLATPDGKITSVLGEGEELLVGSVTKTQIKEARKEWGFRAQLKRRGML